MNEIVSRPTAASSSKEKFVIERTFKSSPAKVWAMWTTKEGLEKWWGPEGFTSEVRHLDLRVGGHFEIVMTAVLPAIVAHLKASGLDASSVAKGNYAIVETERLLAYDNGVDFVPGVAPYTTTTRVEITKLANGGTRLVVANDVMHDANWTEMARQGWTQQIDKLVRFADEPHVA